MVANNPHNNIDWLQHTDIQDFLKSKEIPNPWFHAYRSASSNMHQETWYSALVPIPALDACLEDISWDLGLTDGKPSIWTHYEHGEVSDVVYYPFGNEKGVEPLVILREFHGMREDFLELSQDFRLYHNLYHEPGRKRFIHISDHGDESVAAEYDRDVFKIRTDLLLSYCKAKQMALAIFVDSFRNSTLSIEEFGLLETRKSLSGDSFVYHFSLFPSDDYFNQDHKTTSGVMGKKYIFPLARSEKGKDGGAPYQEFVIDSDAQGNLVKHTCNPSKLANYFGANPDAPHYLTPVFFRVDVLSKYYADPQKYSVEDGYLRCGGLWGVRIDNDHTDYVVVWLGDIGRDMSESERNYWLNFNVPPQGRGISNTNFKRAFLAEPTNPTKADLVFKYEYEQFQREFSKAKGWDFFLPLHDDDEHFLTGLHLLSKDSQSEFDSQLIALTKLLIDSLNEKKITAGLTTLTNNDKGITKLEKYFIENGAAGYEPHIKFLRVLQDLRSKSAAHRKGGNYEKLIADLELEDKGQQSVFTSLIIAGSDFIGFLRGMLRLTPP